MRAYVFVCTYMVHRPESESESSASSYPHLVTLLMHMGYVVLSSVLVCTEYCRWMDGKIARSRSSHLISSHRIYQDDRGSPWMAVYTYTLPSRSVDWFRFKLDSIVFDHFPNLPRGHVIRVRGQCSVRRSTCIEALTRRRHMPFLSNPIFTNTP